MLQSMLSWAVVAIVLLGQGGAAEPPARVEREAYVMGTRVSLVTYDWSRADGLRRLERYLQILENTDRALSTWRDDSVISAFNRWPAGDLFGLSPALCRMFEEVWRLSESTGGRFDPGIGALVDVWGVQAGGRVATAEEVQEARQHSGLSRVAFDPGRCTLTRRAGVRLDSGAFGKGDALDRIAALPESARNPWLVDLGGQVAAGGHPPGEPAWAVALAHPHQRDEAMLRLALDGGSLSTSGGSERDVPVDGRRISHIIDPRSGQPATFDGSVTVWHGSALAADALSTALFVMGPDEGLAWADGRGLAACYLDPDGGGVRALASRAFRERFRTCGAARSAP